MKVNDIVENVIDDMLEEGGEEYENAALLTILSYLQNRAADTHKQPRIRADSLINLVQDAGYPQANCEKECEDNLCEFQLIGNLMKTTNQQHNHGRWT